MARLIHYPESYILIRSLLCAAGSLTSLITVAATAQTEPVEPTGKVEEIVVTGSRIRGIGPVGSPVVGIDQDDLAKLGVANAAEALRTVPAVLNLGADPSHQNANQKANLNITAGTAINLRGLGQSATLVLVDGRRIAPAGVGAQFTDPSVIPSAAIGQFEVVADGASAIYGADAVGGVVNLKLREPFTGAESTLRYGGGVGQSSLDASQVVSYKWDTGGFLVALHHLDQDRLKASSVSNLYTDNFTFHGYPNAGTNNSYPGNLVVGSTFYALPANPTGAVLTFSQLTAGTKNIQGVWTGADAVPAQTMDNGVFTVKQQLTDDLKLFSEGFFSRRKFDQIGRLNSVILSVPAVNPFYIKGVPGVAAGANETVDYSLTGDVGNPHVEGGQKAGSGTIGLTWAPFGDWQIEPSISYSEDNEQRISDGNINNCGLNGALGVSPTGTGGSTLFGVACSGTPILYSTNPATAFDPFAPGTTNPASLTAIYAFLNDQTEFDRLGAAIRADGSIYELPGGKVRLAVGFEHYDDTLIHHQTRNDSNYTPNTQTTFQFAGTNKRTNNSIYGEMFVPIFGRDNAIPFLNKLELSLAGRFEHYSDFGSTTNPKYGLNWKPTDELVVHASYGTSFRAPTLSEEDGKDIVGTPGVTYGQTTNGLYSSLGPIGGKVNTITYVGGNSSVKPESATTYSFGVDYVPKWLPGANLTLNYFNVNYQNVIGSVGTANALTDPTLAAFVNLHPTAAQIQAACTSLFFTSASCTPAPVAILDGTTHNLGSTKTNGLEITLNYRTDTPWGELSGGLTGIFVNSYKQALLPGAPLVERVNQVNFPLQTQGRLTLGWENNGFAATTFLNYENGYSNQTVTPFQNVDPYVTVDLTASYDSDESFSSIYLQHINVSVHVQNLLDSTPPFVYQPGFFYAFDPQNASPFGRTAYLQVSKKF